MLKPMEKTINISSGSIIQTKDGDAEVAGFSLSINSVDPFGMGISTWVNDRTAYSKSIAKCREDEDAFRTYARELQDEMIAALEQEDPDEPETTE